MTSDVLNGSNNKQMTQICILTNVLQRLFLKIIEHLSSDILSEKSIPKIVYYLLSISHLKPSADVWICKHIHSHLGFLSQIDLFMKTPSKIHFLPHLPTYCNSESLPGVQTRYQWQHDVPVKEHWAEYYSTLDRQLLSLFVEQGFLWLIGMLPTFQKLVVYPACSLSFWYIPMEHHKTANSFTGARNYTSGYTQCLPWFLHSKTSWRCQMYSLMVQSEQWPANRPCPQHVLIPWAHPNIQNHKRHIAALGMGTHWGALSTVVLCCTDIKGVQLGSLTTSLCNL